MIVKVVYFDEGSATDFLHIDDGGQTQQKTEKIGNTTSKVVAKADASAEAKFKWLPFLGVSTGITASAEGARLGNTIISKAISNTILTDYLDRVKEKKDNGLDVITIFTECKLTPHPESFAYYKMMTPYLIMVDDKVQSGGISLNISKMDEAFESGRGYYELIAEGSGSKCILRFNIKAFRNNYGIADLVKMNLTYHAIEVGTFPEEKLALKEEFSEDDGIPITGVDIVNSLEVDRCIRSTKLLKVYDVVLAGVDK